MLVFEERGKVQHQEKNLSEQSREQTNSTHIVMIWSLVMEHGPHWWEVSALTTTPIPYT